MKIEEIKAFIKKARYHTEYVPIVHRQSLEIFAFEANSKFTLGKKKVSTNKFFKELLHNNKIFFYLEQRNKKLQIDNFPKDIKLFLHFDAAVFSTKEQREFWKDYLTFFSENIVIGITENRFTKDTSTANLKSFTKWIAQNHFESSINNFVKDGTMFSFKAIQRAKYIKIDRKFIKKIEQNIAYKEFVKNFVHFCNANDKEVILTGVDTKQDLDIANELNVNFVQGYYFHQESFSA